LSKRQFNILEFIREKESVSNQEVKNYLEEKNKEKISRITVVRDINDLLKKKLIKKSGEGRNTRYQEAIKNKILKYVDVDEYFKKGPDERKVVFDRFNFDIFEELKEIFSKQELKELNELNKNYQKRIKKLSPAVLKKEFERLTIELSWKSSQIEGNTYSLIDTEILIKENKEADGHKKEEAIMILNHKKALDYILFNKNDFKKINLRKLEDVHDILIKDLNVSNGIRKGIVGIVGTKYRPLDNEFQIREALEKTLKLANGLKDSFSKALILILLISYIQPFEDGNKRTSRLIGNAVFLANNICPLSYRSINEADYKKAIILFYEQNNIRFFKELFINQFKFAVENYF
ncbi:Fic family protein, partial [Patescibacteria group bacterium]|nr:Fic family protein [Patescibacteria group bacterium]